MCVDRIKTKDHRCVWCLRRLSSLDLNRQSHTSKNSIDVRISNATSTMAYKMSHEELFDKTGSIPLIIGF